MASLDFSMRWMSRVIDRCQRALLPVQDGMNTADVRQLIGPRLGLFVGGSTEWKLDTLCQWGSLGRETGIWVHVGRVNSVRRIRMCEWAGVTSFDGSGPSRYSVVLPRLDDARRQLSMFVSQAESAPPCDCCDA